MASIEKVLQFLHLPANKDGVEFGLIRKHVKEEKKIVNQILYALEKVNKVRHISLQKPNKWIVVPAQASTEGEAANVASTTPAVQVLPAAASTKMIPASLAGKAAVTGNGQAARNGGLPLNQSVPLEGTAAQLDSSIDSMQSIKDAMASLKLHGMEQVSPGALEDSCALPEPVIARKLGTNTENVTVASTEIGKSSAVALSHGDDYRKPNSSDNVSVKFIRELASASEKVAMFVGPFIDHCTGFRVGTHYFMTAAHAVGDIIKGSDPGSSESERLKSYDVYAVFDYNETCSKDSKKYFFEKWYWLDKDVDVAVLQFDEKSRATVGFPSAFPSNMFSIDNSGDTLPNNEPISIIGHEDNKKQEAALNGKVCKPDFVQLNSDHPGWYEEAESRQGDFMFYEGAALKGGSSGSPVFTKRDDSLMLSGVHLTGYPSSAVRQGQVNIYCFQAGAKMSAVYRIIHSTNEELCSNIFALSQ